VLVAGYRRLRANLADLDLPAARAALLARYGRAAVSARLLDAYANPTGPGAGSVSSTVDGQVAGTGHAAVVAVTWSAAARDLVHRLAERYAGVDVITSETARWRQGQVPPGVRLHGLEEAEQRRPGLRVRQTLLVRAPSAMLAGALGLARMVGPLGPAVAVSRAQRLHHRLATRSVRPRRGWFAAVTRPRSLWRIVRRDVLPALDLTRTSRVVIVGALGVTIGWRLARRYPSLTVTTSLALPPQPTEAPDRPPWTERGPAQDTVREAV
jgi:hypothetical protein